MVIWKFCFGLGRGESFWGWVNWGKYIDIGRKICVGREGELFEVVVVVVLFLGFEFWSGICV